MIRTTVPVGFGKGSAFYGTHMNKLMNELKPNNCIHNGGLVTQQAVADMTVVVPDLIYSVGTVINEYATGNSPLLTAATAGRAQIETQTVEGAIEAAGVGNALVTITAAGLTNGAKAFEVAVDNNDTAAVVAGKIQTDLTADPDISALYTVGGVGADITLTQKTLTGNDDDLNIAVEDGTCIGLTAKLVSVDTQSGQPRKRKMAVLEIGVNGTVDARYGTEVDLGVTPVIPAVSTDHARICAIGPIEGNTTAIVTALINNTEREISR